MEWIWDEAKAARNLAKHGVRFEIALIVFADENQLTLSDPHPDGNRQRTVGMVDGAVLFVVHTVVAADDIVKRDKSDKRRKVAGRADLWISGDQRCYSFEFKRAWHSATIKNLEATLSRARADIEVIDNDESHYAAGVVLAYVRDESRIERYRNFANHENVDFAYRIGPDGVTGAYLFFSIKA